MTHMHMEERHQGFDPCPALKSFLHSGNF